MVKGTGMSIIKGMRSIAPSRLNPRTAPRTAPRAASRTILTVVKEEKVGKQFNWKQYAVTIVVKLILLVVVIVIGAGMFIGLQKMEKIDLKRKCLREKDSIKEELRATCGKPEMADQCTASWKKSKFEQLAKCFGHPPSPSKPPNTMARALVYAYSTYTTIGYGNVAAQSTGGKAFSIIYALIGAPLFLGFLNHVGKWYHYWLVLSYEWLRRRTGGGKDFELTTKDPEDVGVFVFALFIIFGYLLLAAALYATLQNWEYWQSFYFAYQSMALIGFGDVFLELEDASFIMIHMQVTTVGVTLLAMVFFILRDYWSRTVVAISNAISEKLKIIAPMPASGVFEEDDTLRQESVTFSMDLDDDSSRSLRAKTGSSKKAPKTPPSKNASSKNVSNKKAPKKAEETSKKSQKPKAVKSKKA